MMRRAWMAAAGVGALCAGCIGTPTKFPERPDVSKGHPSMGTVLDISLWSPLDESADAAIKQALQRVDGIEHTFSHFIPDSEINRFNRTPVGEPFPLSGDFLALRRPSDSVAARTNGAFSCRLYPLLWRKGFFPPAHEKEQEWADELDPASCTFEAVEWSAGPPAVAIRRHKDAGVDFDGIAKGYALDEARAILAPHFAAGKLSYGSTTLMWGDRETHFVGLLPAGCRAEGGYAFSLSRGGVSTSSCEENSRDGACHVVDPLTLGDVGAGPMWQATAVAASATEADALSTALLTQEPEEAMATLGRFGAAGVLISRRGVEGRGVRRGEWWIYVSPELALKVGQP